MVNKEHIDTVMLMHDTEFIKNNIDEIDQQLSEFRVKRKVLMSELIMGTDVVYLKYELNGINKLIDTFEKKREKLQECCMIHRNKIIMSSREEHINKWYYSEDNSNEYTYFIKITNIVSEDNYKHLKLDCVTLKGYNTVSSKLSDKISVGHEIVNYDEFYDKNYKEITEDEFDDYDYYITTLNMLIHNYADISTDDSIRDSRQSGFTETERVYIGNQIVYRAD